MRFIVMFTRAALSSEGPRNYALRLTTFLRNLGLDVNVDISLNNVLMLFKILYYVSVGNIVIIPFVKGIELLAIFLAMPFAIVRGSKIIIVNHDVHGLFYAKVPLLWRLLIIMRSGRLFDIPLSPIRIIYVSRYSKLSSYIVTGSRNVLKMGVVIYPITWKDVYGIYSIRHYKNANNLCIFTKVSKMMMEDFWYVLGKCLDDLLRKGIDFNLIIMGGGSQQDIANLKNIILKHLSSDAQRRVIFKFNVSNEERDVILKSTAILIYSPSTEGLGMPVFEGIMIGVPVISARQTALIEFVPSWIYPYREFRYLDFCKALVEALMNYDELIRHVRYVKRIIITTTLTNLKQLLQIL